MRFAWYKACDKLYDLWCEIVIIIICLLDSEIILYAVANDVVSNSQSFYFCLK